MDDVGSPRALEDALVSITSNTDRDDRNAINLSPITLNDNRILRQNEDNISSDDNLREEFSSSDRVVSGNQPSEPNEVSYSFDPDEFITSSKIEELSKSRGTEMQPKTQQQRE